MFVIPIAMGQAPGFGTHPVVTALVVLAFGTLPVCMGVAVLKYQLYEAEALVVAFTARMRHSVDFDAVRDDLVGVVHEAFQPTQVSMWLVLARGQDVAGLEQRLEVGQDPRPAL